MAQTEHDPASWRLCVKQQKILSDSRRLLHGGLPELQLGNLGVGKAVPSVAGTEELPAPRGDEIRATRRINGQTPLHVTW